MSISTRCIPPPLQAADVNLLVMQLNVPSAKNAERFVGVLRRMGVEATKSASWSTAM